MFCMSLILMLSVSMSEETEAELRADAEAKMEAGAYVAAGEVYVTLAALEGVVRRDEMLNAHSSFELAYLTDHASPPLCRALGVAEVVVREAAFADGQMEQFWRELAASDLEQLKQDAKTTQRANCRFSATGEAWKPVLLLAEDRPSPATQMLAAMTVQHHVREDMADRAVTVELDEGMKPTRRFRAQTTAGAVFVGFGIASVGAFAGALAVGIDQVRAIRATYNLIAGEERGPSPAEQDWALERRATAYQAQTLAISAGVAAVVTLATGGALLGTRKRFARPVTLRPYGGGHGAGFVLRGQF